MSIELQIGAALWLFLYARFYWRGLETNLPARYGWDAHIIGSGIAATITGLPIFAILAAVALARGF